MTKEYPLYSLLIEITQKCNAACDQCGSRCDIHSEEPLSAETLLAALRDIADNIGTYTMLNITGGEPTMRADLYEIMTEASRMGFDWGMVSNGSLITESTIRKMRDAGMKTITISLDGLKETHESLRHLPGSFDRIISALRMLKQADFLDHLQVTFTANRRNVYEFEELYRILEPIGLDSIRVSFMDPIGRAQEHTDLLLTREEILYFTGLVNTLNRRPRGVKIVWGCPHYLGDLVENRRFTCFAGIYNASILANGDIFVCPNVPRRKDFIQGNILTDSFSEAWKNGFRYFRNRPLPEKCESCEKRDVCAGDSLHTMDFDRNEPNFCFRDYLESQDAKTFENDFFMRNAEFRFSEISGDDPDAAALIFEPEAFRDVKRYFHFGSDQPQSMFEQQMALIGFSVGSTGVVRYVIPCDGGHRAADNALFTNRIMRTVEAELRIINKNYYKSSDRALPGSECSNGQPMKFLGFIHSHPTQPELQYSTGDDAIHSSMLRKFGAYFGVLTHPASEALGAYYGKDFRQARLIVPEL